MSAGTRRRWKVLPGFQPRRGRIHWYRLRSYATEARARAEAEARMERRRVEGPMPFGVEIVRVYCMDWGPGRVDEYTLSGMVERDLLAEVNARAPEA